MMAHSIHLHQYPRILRFWCRSAKRLGANKRMIEIVIYCFVSVTDTPGPCAERNCPRLGSNPGLTGCQKRALAHLAIPNPRASVPPTLEGAGVTPASWTGSGTPQERRVARFRRRLDTLRRLQFGSVALQLACSAGNGDDRQKPVKPCCRNLLERQLEATLPSA